MSRLYYNEEGRVLPTLCEELTTFRRARKVLVLPKTSQEAHVYVLARCYPDHEAPLRLSVNGFEMEPVKGLQAGVYRWYDVVVSADRLQAGENVFDLWTDTTAMNGWSLALEPGHANPNSAISDDGGKTWRKERMGYLNAVLGEYVVRVRLAEGEDPPPPPMAWENQKNPRLSSLRKLLPPVAVDDGPLLRRVRALSAWLASSWEHTGSGRATQYAPWDAETVLDWGKKEQGHNGKRAIAMCVHFAAALVSCAQAVGIPARCAVLTAAINGFNGHFVTEVWSEEHDKWVVVDPNADALFMKNGVPMAMNEIQAEGAGIKDLIEYGKGTEFQRTFPHMVSFVNNNLEKGVCFKHRSVWYRSDLLTHPELTPPGHGSLCYCETGLVWEKRDLDAGFGMFPFFGDRDYFDKPPSLRE